VIDELKQEAKQLADEIEDLTGSDAPLCT